MKRFIPAIAVAALTLAGASTAMASTTAVPHHTTAKHAIHGTAPLFTNRKLKSVSGALCINADGHTGHEFFGKTCASRSSHAQQMSTHYLNICNGGHKVTNTCPFPAGSGLNDGSGDAIVYVENINSGRSINQLWSPDREVQGVAHYGWVQIGTCSSSCQFIDFKDSTSSSHEGTLCVQGTNQATKVEWSPSSGRCAFVTH